MKKLIALLSVLALTVLASCGKTEVIEENITTGSEIEDTTNIEVISDEENTTNEEDTTNIEVISDEENTTSGESTATGVTDEDMVIEVM